jgi:hypothetical protein
MKIRLPGWRTAIVHGVLYLLGAAHWVAFLDFGRIPFGLYDWRQEHFYLSVLKRAVTAGEIPRYVSPLFHFNAMFLSSPLSVLAPHAILLRWISLPSFEVFHVLLLYTIGFAGGAVFKAKHRLSWPSYLVFFLLFNFNGYLTSHLAVGHVVWWAGYYFLPWFFLGILDWVREGPTLRLALKLSMVIFAMSLMGSFHFCTWCAVFLILLGLRKSGWLTWAGLVLAVSAGLAAYRLLPGLAGFGKLAHGSPAGYPSLWDMLAALAALRLPSFPTVNAMGWWEYDMYVGWAGFAMLAFFGACSLVPGPGGKAPFSRLDLPVAGTVLLSYWEAYWFFLGGVPVLSVERVVSRMLVMPVVLLAMLAAVRLDESRRALSRVPFLPLIKSGVLALMAVQLAGHSWTWRVSALAVSIPDAYVTPASPAIVPGPGGLYTAGIFAGWAVTIAVLALVVRALARETKTGA